MFTFIAGVILRNRIIFIVAVLLVTAFMAYKAREVKLSYEHYSLLPKKDSTLIEFNRYTEIFGKDGNLVVIGIQNSEFFDPSSLGNWFSMKDSLRAIKGVKSVVSITNVYNLIKNNDIRSFEIIPLAPEAPLTRAEADNLQQIVLSLPFYRDLLYDSGSETYLILVTLEREVLLSGNRNSLIENIEKISQEYAAKQNLNVHYSGLPYIRIKTAEKIEGELYMFILLALLITGIIMFLFFRSFRVVFFSLIVVATGVVWSLGSMVLLGYEITLLTAMIPPLLIVIGIPNSVFLLNKYHNEYRNHGNKIKALQRVIQKIGAATFLTNLTTSAGFATFILTSTKILQEFGVIASLNIMGIFLLSLLLIPIIFSFLPEPQERHVRHLENIAVRKVIGLFEYLAVNHRRKTYPLAILLIVSAILGITRIKSTGYVVDDLPENDPVSVDMLFFEEHFQGLIPLEIIIDTKRPRAVFTRATLQNIDRLQSALEKYPELSKPLSITEAFKFTRQSFFDGDPYHYRLPSNTEINFIMAYMGNLEGNNDISSSFIDKERQITRVSYKVADVGTEKTGRLKQNIRQELKATGLDIRKSVSNAIREAGVSMLYTSIVLFFGFGIFALSGFGGTKALGVLVSFTLLIAVTSNLILLPSMLLSLEKIIIGRNFEEPLMHIYDEPENNFLVDSEESYLRVKKNKDKVNFLKNLNNNL